MNPQTLSLIGIILEGLSVIIIGYEVFYGYPTQLEIEGRTFRQELKSKRIKMGTSWLLLTIGLLLQIAGLYNVTI